MALTTHPPVWIMSLNILFFFLDVTPYVYSVTFVNIEDKLKVRRVQEKKRGRRSRGFEQPKWYTDLALIGQEET